MDVYSKFYLKSFEYKHIKLLIKKNSTKKIIIHFSKLIMLGLWKNYKKFKKDIIYSKK